MSKTVTGPKTVLLPLLADGEFRSGQELAGQLGISRTAVWKQLQKLQQLGLPLETSKSRGYRIPGGIELLDAAAVLSGLSAASRARLSRLQIDSVIDSTNAEALRQLQRGESAGLVCVAEQQTAGRGRRGRQWVSPFAGNLYLSLVWEFAGGAAALEGLSLAVAVAVADALACCGADEVQLKWPNDILYKLAGGKSAKLGGILIEMLGDAAGACQVVIGLGLNIKMPAAAGANIDQAWTDLSRVMARPPSRNRVLQALLEELLALLPAFAERGFAPWRERWLERDACRGKDVVVYSGRHQSSGRVAGISASGALLLHVGDGIRTVHGGEVSLRVAP